MQLGLGRGPTGAVSSVDRRRARAGGIGGGFGVAWQVEVAAREEFAVTKL